MCLSASFFVTGGRDSAGSRRGDIHTAVKGGEDGCGSQER